MAAEEVPTRAEQFAHRWNLEGGPQPRYNVRDELRQKVGERGWVHIRPTESGIRMITDPDRVFNRAEYAQKRPRPSVDPKRFSVEVHGSPNGVRFRGVELNAKELAEIIREAPGYKAGEPVRLLSCRTGAEPADGSPSFAQELSRELGAEVLAPNSDAWVDNFGNIYASAHRATFEQDASGAPQPHFDEPGQWVAFHPDGTRAVHDSPYPPGHEPEWTRAGHQAEAAQRRGGGGLFSRLRGLFSGDRSTPFEGAGASGPSPYMQELIRQHGVGSEQNWDFQPDAGPQPLYEPPPELSGGQHPRQGMGASPQPGAQHQVPGPYQQPGAPAPQHNPYSAAPQPNPYQGYGPPQGAPQQGGPQGFPPPGPSRPGPYQEMPPPGAPGHPGAAHGAAPQGVPPRGGPQGAPPPAPYRGTPQPGAPRQSAQPPPSSAATNPNLPRPQGAPGPAPRSSAGPQGTHAPGHGPADAPRSSRGEPQRQPFHERTPQGGAPARPANDGFGRHQDGPQRSAEARPPHEPRPTDPQAPRGPAHQDPNYNAPPASPGSRPGGGFGPMGSRAADPSHSASPHADARAGATPQRHFTGRRQPDEDFEDIDYDPLQHFQSADGRSPDPRAEREPDVRDRVEESRPRSSRMDEEAGPHAPEAPRDRPDDPDPADRAGGESSGPDSGSGVREHPSLDDLIPQEGADFDEAELLARVKGVVDGQYAHLKVEVDSISPSGGAMTINSSIFDSSGKWVGTAVRDFTRLDDGNLIANHKMLKLNHEVRGGGFASEFNGAMERWYRQSGVREIMLRANIDVGCYAWARQHYEFLIPQQAVDRILPRLKNEIDSTRSNIQEKRIQLESLAEGSVDRLEAEAEIRDLEDAVRDARDIVRRFRVGDPEFPTPFEISEVGRPSDADPGRSKKPSWLGKRVLMGLGNGEVEWHGVKRL